MEIGPITGIQPVPIIKRSGSAPDLSRVFEVEYLGESADDDYSPANQKAARGLEDEEEDRAEEIDQPGVASPEIAPASKISFFA